MGQGFLRSRIRQNAGFPPRIPAFGECGYLPETTATTLSFRVRDKTCYGHNNSSFERILVTEQSLERQELSGV
jgi:hypothetical protein